VYDTAIANDEQIDRKRVKIGDCCMYKIERIDPFFQRKPCLPSCIEDMKVAQGIPFLCKDYVRIVAVRLCIKKTSQICLRVESYLSKAYSMRARGENSVQYVRSISGKPSHQDRERNMQTHLGYSKHV
jgi:hypothetical protein